MEENVVTSSSSLETTQKLNFTNIRVLVREVMERFLYGDVSTTMNDKMMIEQLIGSDQSREKNVQKLKQKKQNLENRLENKRSELMEKAFRKYNVVDLHRKHTSTVVLADSSTRIIIEHNNTSAGKKSVDLVGLKWIIGLMISLFSRIVK